jgi:hypothetical protein
MILRRVLHRSHGDSASIRRLLHAVDKTQPGTFILGFNDSMIVHQHLLSLTELKSFEEVSPDVSFQASIFVQSRCPSASVSHLSRRPGD